MGMGPLGLCYVCVANHKLYRVKKENQTLPEGTAEPMVYDAVTMVPTWQQQQVGVQMVMACVTVPTCENHIEVKELSELDKVIQGGRILQARLEPGSNANG